MDQIEGAWSPEEDDMLLNLFKKHGRNWSPISKSIPGRSKWSCLSRWLSLQRSFTPEEDEILQNLVEKHGPNWSLISESIPGRSARLCELRWLSLQWSFTPEEDEMLLNLVEKHDLNWSIISKSIPGKLAKACELRWLSLQWSFTPEEDKMLLNLFKKHGPNWSLISKSIPGRSEWSCLSRWLSLQRSFTPEEDKMLLKLVDKHGRNNWSLISESIPGRSAKTCCSRWLSLQRSFTPEEDKMLLNRCQKHGRNWSLISNSIPGRSAKSCELRWDTFQNSMTNEDITISDHNIFIESVSDINRGQRNSYIHDLNLSLARGGVSDQAPSIGDMVRDNVSQPSGGMPTMKSLLQELNKIAGLDKHKIYTTETTETRSQNSIHQGNSSHEVGGVVSGYQPPSISDMDRGNMSSGGTHSYSSDHSAPSWNALYIRDSSPMMIDSDNVQQFVGGEFGSQNSLHEGNSSQEVGGMVRGQPPSISDMARGNMSSGGTHSYSRDHSAPSCNALYIRDSSPMMIDSVSVQQSVGGEFGRNDFSEVSSKA